MNLLDDTLLNLAGVKALCGFSSSWIYQAIAENRFPHPIKIGQASRWSRNEVHAWVQNQIAERDRAA